MPLLVRSLLLALVLLGRPEASSAQELSLEELVRQTKAALLKVQQEWQDPRLGLSRVILEVQTLMEVEAEGGISLYFVRLGGSRSSSVSNTMTLTLVPPDPDAPSDVSNTPIADALADAILSAAEAVEEASRGQPPLVAEAFTATIRFAVVQSGEGGVELAFPPFEGSAGGGISSSDVHSVAAHFVQ